MIEHNTHRLFSGSKLVTLKIYNNFDLITNKQDTIKVLIYLTLCSGFDVCIMDTSTQPFSPSIQLT